MNCHKTTCVVCAGKTVRFLQNACHTWALWRFVHDKTLYKSTFAFPTLPYLTTMLRASYSRNVHAYNSSVRGKAVACNKYCSKWRLTHTITEVIVDNLLLRYMGVLEWVDKWLSDVPAWRMLLQTTPTSRYDPLWSCPWLRWWWWH